ncbi:hypothetical protein IAD21_06461 (plasmid) [Abditibacteriota bacterium]|nr:hypothetical protein IAD21_06461 [Abditibacteriota bacterium]
MPADNTSLTPLLDIHDFILAQRAERFRAFILHGPPLSGKSSFARRLAQHEGGLYIDVLSLVNEDPLLADRVDTLDALWLEDQVRAAIRAGASFIVVDEFDFLWPIWGDTIAPLLHRIERFYSETPVAIAWVMPSHRALKDASISRANGMSRVLPLENIKAL